MHLKQKLKQKINLALFFRACFYAVFSQPTREWSYRKGLKRKGRNEENKKGRKLLQSITQAGTYLSVSRSTVYRLIQDGTLQVVYVRGIPRITQRSLSELAGGRNG